MEFNNNYYKQREVRLEHKQELKSDLHLALSISVLIVLFFVLAFATVNF